MTDGLYLDGTWVAEVEAALNYQVNDLTKPDTIESTYSTSFNLADTLLMRDLTQNAEQLDSGGVHPYQYLSAKLVEEGEVIFSGSARLQSFKGGWTVNLFQISKSLFEALASKSLRDLDLSRFDHVWTPAGISARAGADKGIVYPVIDYGAYDGDTFADDAVFPAVYAHTLIQQMLLEAGYRPAGNWLQDDLIKRIALPFVSDEANNQDEQWVEDRTARVTVGPGDTAEYSNAEVELNPFPYTVDNDAEASFYDGKSDNFKPALKAYVCDTAMRLHVQAAQTLKVKVGFGAMEVFLQVLRNGQVVGETREAYGGPHNISFTSTETIKLDETIACAPGDQITIRYVYQKQTTFVSSHQRHYIDAENSWASFKPDPAILPGDQWITSRGLPDMSCADLLISLALMTSSTYDVNDLRRTVRMVPLDSVIANTANAVDWSDRVEESDEPELTPSLEPYGQRNNVRWKEFDFVSELSTSSKAKSSSAKRNPMTTLFGDGVITSPAGNLPVVTDLFELPFAACQNSDKSLTGYGTLLLIRTRRVTGTGTSRTVERQSTEPRFVLIEPSVTVEASINSLGEDLVLKKLPITLTGCWWSDRPGVVKKGDNKFCLAFDRVSPTHREQTLVPRYFTGLKRVLRRPRSLSVSVCLRPEDVATLDLMLPIRLRRVRAGALDLNDNYYYLNKVQNYLPVTTCTVQLVAYF